MKKVFSILMACSLTFTMSACSSKPETAQTTPQAAETAKPADQAAGGTEELKPEAGAKLIVWEGKDEKAFVEAIAKQFTAKYNIPVEVQEVVAGEQMARMKTDGPAGLGADVMVMPHDHLGEATAAGIIMPNDYYAEDTKKNFVEASINAVTMGGTLYGYPRNMETYALYYNKNLVKKEDLSSWDNIIKFAKGYNDPASNKFGFMWEVNNFYYNIAWILGSGGYVFGKNNSDPADVGLNSPGAVEGMKFYQSLKEALPIKAADATEDVKKNLFTTGKLPIDLNGIWQLGNYSKEKLGFDVGVAPLPKMPNGKEPITFAGVKAYYVSSFSKFPNAARLFSHFATTQESLSTTYKMLGLVPARKGMENDPAIQNNENVKAFMEQFKHSQPMPAIIEMRQVWGPATAALEPIWNGGDVKQLLDKAAADIKTGIASQGR